MSCEVQLALTITWDTATREFSEAVNALAANRIGTMSKDEYDRLRANVETARLASESARLAVERHCAEHGC